MNFERVFLLSLMTVILTTHTECQQKNDNRILQDSMETEHSVVMDITYLIKLLNWKSVVIFYDGTKEREFQQVVKVASETKDHQISTLTFDLTTVTLDGLDTILTQLHHLYTTSETIKVILFCDDENTVLILSAASTIDSRYNRLLDYRHRSYWLVITTWNISDTVTQTVSTLDNIAILPLRTTFCEKNTFAVFPSCRLACEDRYILSAYGVAANREWRCFSYDSLKRRGVRGGTLLYPNSKYGYNRRELLVTTRKSGSCSIISYKDNDTVNTGYCFNIFQHVATGFNFSYRVIQTGDLNWGHKEADENWTGMIGELQRGEADIAIVDVTFHENRSSVVDFVLPGLGVLHEVVLYRKNLDRELSLVSFLDPFHSTVYLVLTGILLIVPVLCFGIEWSLVDDKNSMSLQEVHFYFVGSIFQQGGSFNPVSWSGRTVVATFWLGSMCLAVFYTAYLTASLTTGKDVQPFTNVQELVERDDYKLGTKGRGPSYDMLKSATGGPLRDMWLKIVESNRTDPTVIEVVLEKVLDKVLNENYAVILTDRLARYAMTRDCRFAVLKDVVVWQQFSFAIRKSSPFKKDIERMFARVVENGLSKYPQGKSKKAILRCDRLRGRSVDMSYTLGKVSVLVIGLTMAVVVLILEHVLRIFLCRKLR